MLLNSVESSFSLGVDKIASRPCLIRSHGVVTALIYHSARLDRRYQLVLDLARCICIIVSRNAALWTQDLSSVLALVDGLSMPCH